MALTQMLSRLPLLALPLLCALTGCSAFQIKDPASEKYRPSDPGYLAGAQSMEVYQKVRQAKAQNGIVLEVVGDSEPVRVLPLPPGGQSVFVSNLLEQTGVLQKIGALDAVLYRSSPSSIEGVRMEVRMGKNHRSVQPESDYALQPGDRLRVKKHEIDSLQGILKVAGVL